MPKKQKVQKKQFARKAFGLTYSCPVNAEDNPITTHEELIQLFDQKGINKVARARGWGPFAFPEILFIPYLAFLKRTRSLSIPI